MRFLITKEEGRGGGGREGGKEGQQKGRETDTEQSRGRRGKGGGAGRMIVRGRLKGGKKGDRGRKVRAENSFWSQTRKEETSFFGVDLKTCGGRKKASAGVEIRCRARKEGLGVKREGRKRKLG